MKNNFFSVIDRTKVVQDGYFLYDHSNLVKKKTKRKE